MTVRVLQISRSVIDGGFDYHREISQAFSDGNFDVTTVFLRGTLSRQRADSYYGAVHCLDARHHRIYKNATAALLWLLVLTRGQAFDLVIAHHQTPAVIVNRLRRFLDFRRMYCLVHDFDYFNVADTHGRLRNAYVERRLDERCRFIAVSRAIRDNVLGSMPFLDQDRCLVIHNAIDTKALESTQMDRQDARQQLGIEPGSFVFGTVGRLVPFKAHRELIEAFALAAPNMPHGRLVIIGRGPLQSELERRVSELGLEGKVQITGFVPDASRLMPAFDVFVLPSHNEPFGLVLLEAMASRLPVVANNTGAVPEILPYSDGLADVSDSPGFSDTLMTFFNMTEQRRRDLGEQGCDHTKNEFGIARYRENFRRLWKI